MITLNSPNHIGNKAGIMVKLQFKHPINASFKVKTVVKEDFIQTTLPRVLEPVLKELPALPLHGFCYDCENCNECKYTEILRTEPKGNWRYHSDLP